jgi:hypothetical protein
MPGECTMHERPVYPTNMSISACMRALYSSDQWAPGFGLALPCDGRVGGFLVSLGNLRVPAFSLSVTRVGWVEDEVELSIQSFLAPSGLRVSPISGDLDYLRCIALTLSCADQACKNLPTIASARSDKSDAGRVRVTVWTFD